MNDNSEEENSELILGRFRIQKIIQKQQRFKRYLLKDVFGGERAELKSQKQGHPKPTILHEAGFLQDLQGYPGFPLMLWSGNYDDLEMGLITQQIGPNLVSLFPSNKKSFSLATVCLIGIEILKLLEILHDKHAVLTNFAPQNFRIDQKAADKLVIASLYDCKRYRSSRTFQHYKVKEVEYKDKIHLFSSFNRLINMSTSRRDDLESYFFLLVYLVKNQLPWSKIDFKHQSKAQKHMYNLMEPLYLEQSQQKDQLLQGLPRQFQHIFEYISLLKFQQRPNYCLIRLKLKKVLLKLSKVKEPILDWIPILPSLKKQFLNPFELNILSEFDRQISKQFYEPHQKKIQIDNIEQRNGVSHKNGDLFHFIEKKKPGKRKGNCEVM